MSNYTRHEIDKQKMKLAAARAKPERPRFGEQIQIEKYLADQEEGFNSQLRNEDSNLMNELSQKWKGNGGGSRGDAFIMGLQSGMRKESILDDKERMSKHNSGMKKMRAMLESQNMELAKQERLYNARQAIMPNWMAYSRAATRMRPADREQAVDSMIDKYNQVAGTSYRRGPVDSREPWKIALIDGDEAHVVDMMDIMKTPEEMRLEIMMSSPEYQQMEGGLRQEHNMEQAEKGANLQYKQAKANELQGNTPVSVQQRKQDMVASGQIPKGAIHFDEIKGVELKERMRAVREEMNKLEGVERGIMSLNEMERIFEEHPNLSTSLVRWANTAKNDETLIGNFINTISDQDARDAVLQLDKYAANLALGGLEQFKGSKPTDIVKRIMQAAMPNGKYTPGALKPIKRQYMSDFEKQKNKSLEAAKGWRNRYESSYEGIPKSKAEIVVDVISKHPELKKFTDEQILEWAEKRGGYELPR